MTKLLFTLLAASLSAPIAALAENVATYGDYSIHYNALSTNSLSPDVAKAYGIRRSKSRGMINIAVRKKMEDGSDRPVNAKVRAETRNIHSQVSKLTMQRIQEEQAIYYISDFKVNLEENMRFKVEVIPEGSPLRTVEFSQTFYQN